MSRQRWQRRQCGRGRGTAVLAAAVMVGMIFTATGYGAGAADSAVGEIKAKLGEAMGQPVEQRLALLEQLEKDIDQALLEGGFDDKTRAEILRLKYRVQQELAKYPESRQTFLNYLDALESGYSRHYSRLAFRRRIEVMNKREQWPDVCALSEVVKDHYPSEEDTKGIALYYMGLSSMRMNGTMQRARDLFQQMVQESPQSPLRPWGFRMLANCHLSLGDMNACLGTLELLKGQYTGTKWEHYGDMRPAFVHEHQRGDAQRALRIYQQTLERYPDHVYWGYIEKQKARLQHVIEQQLIEDALGRTAKDTDTPCDGSAASAISFALTRRNRLVKRH